MQIIQKYIIQEVLKTFAIVLMVSVVVYLVVDFFEKIDNFFEAGVPMSQALSFFALRIPLIVSQVAPVGVLMAVLIVLGLMARSNELLALQSGGISKLYLLMPLLIIGLVFSLFVFFLAQILVPITMAQANRIWEVKVRKQVSTFKQKDVWIKGSNAIYHIGYFNPGDETISGITMNFFDDDFNLARRIDAKRGFYRKGKWFFRDCVEQVRLKNGTYDIRYPDRYNVKIDLAPEDLKKVVKQSGEMSLYELSDYIQKIKHEGYDPTPYQVDWHAKLAFPAVCLVMTVIGSAIALKNPKQEGITLGIAYGIGISFCYWIIHALCLSLGHSGIMQPFLAAWITNIIFVVPALAFLL